MTSTANKRTFLAFLLCLMGTMALAEPRLNSLDVKVVLADNGDATITEVRHMVIDDTGTEIYIPMRRLDGREVTLRKVTDEQGVQFTNVGRWNTRWSRSEKARKCGINNIDDGLEVCWGLGEKGERTYTVEYTITELLRSYKDQDGLFHEFVTHSIKPMPDHAKVTIQRENGRFDKSFTQIWAFRYDGSFVFEEGKLVAETTDKMDSDESIRLMVAVDKGVFHPSKSVDMTMKEMEEEAFKGSDYEEEEAFKGSDYEEDDIGFWGWLCIILMVVVLPILLLIRSILIWRSKRKATKNLLWYRDIPYQGNLLHANRILNAHRHFKMNYNDLISATVLRLISIGALRIENHYVAPTGLGKFMGKEGSVKPCIAVYELQKVQGLVNFPMLTLLYKMFADAAGEDHILQPKELKNYMSRHTEKVEQMMKMAQKTISLKDVNADMENVRKVYGLKMFLKDFTLANERHVQEVALWKEYLVWAELFGIAKQVRADMMKINPEYLKFDQFYQTMLNERVVRDVTTATLLGTTSAIKSSRSSGGGGFSSHGGGGGGFSGGGGGGGVR